MFNLSREQNVTGSVMAGAGAGAVAVPATKMFIEPAEGAGIKSYIPELGPYGRPSTLIPLGIGLGAGILSVAGVKDIGPTADREFVNRALAAFGGTSIVSAAAAGYATTEAQAAAAGYRLMPAKQKQSPEQLARENKEQTQKQSPEQKEAAKEGKKLTLKS